VNKGISTVVGSLIFLMIMIAFFATFSYIQNQFVNFLNTNLSNLANNSQKNLESLDILSAAYDTYLPSNITASSNENSSYTLIDVYKPFDGIYAVFTNSTTKTKLVNLISTTFSIYIPNFTKFYTNTSYNAYLNLVYNLRISCTANFGPKIYVLYASVAKTLNLTIYSNTLQSNSDNHPSCRSPIVTGFTFNTTIFMLNKNFVQNNLLNITLNLQVQFNSEDNKTVNIGNAELDIDYISLRIFINPPTIIPVYVLNNSPFTSLITQVIVFNTYTNYINNTNIAIPSGAIKLITLKYLPNANVKLITSLGNVYQATIGN